MKIQFDTMFEVELQHAYFKSGWLENFQVEPARQCAEHLRNHGLLLRKTKKGFVVLYEYREDEEGNRHPLRPIEGDLQLSFVVSSTDNLLLNFSELPLDSAPGTIYRLHNLHSNVQDGKLLLTTDRFVSEKDRIEVRPQSFPCCFYCKNPTMQVDLLDEYGTQVFHKIVGSVEETARWNLDVRHLPPGRFVLKTDGKEALTFYASDELVRKKAFCVIDLFRSDAVPEVYRFADNNTDVQRKTYRLGIDQRQTFWKYFVVLKYRTKTTPDELEIKGQGGISFEPGEIFSTAGGFKTVPFVSDKRIPFSEEPVKGIQMVKKVHGHDPEILIEKLQNPSVSSIKPADAGKVYSETFVYL